MHETSGGLSPFDLAAMLVVASALLGWFNHHYLKLPHVIGLTVMGAVAAIGLLGLLITAALFLRRFVEATPRYCHFDIYAWRPTGRPGLSKGGVGQGPRAILRALPDILGL